jgi:rod shape-determining protein MreC
MIMMRQEVRFWTIHVFYVLFVLFLINRIFFSCHGVTERTVSYLLYPFFKIHTSIVSSVHQKSEHRQNLQALQKELDGLYVQHDVLKGRVAQLQAQQLFVEQSQEVVDFAHRYEVDNKKIAKTLLCYESLQEDAMFIEGGSDNGISKDDVVVYENALIGRVIEVYSWYSKVALITDQRCKVSAQTSEDAVGICCGKNNKKLEFCFVPHFKKVLVGDVVTSTGQGLMYPQGFALGIVQKVTTDLVSHQIELKPYFDIKNISYVYVFTKQH